MHEFKLLSDNTDLLKELLEQHISDNCSNQIKKQIDVNEKELANYEKWIEQMAKQYQGDDYESIL